jgi:hypothetical protein
MLTRWKLHLSQITVFQDNVNMHRIAAKFVPHAEGQKNLVNTFQNLRERPERDLAFLSNIITSDKMWVYAHDPETKQKSSRWRSQSPRPNKAGQDHFTKTWRVCSLFLFQHSRSCASWSCSTRTKYTQTLTYWHPMASARKCEAKRLFSVHVFQAKTIWLLFYTLPTHHI